MRKLILTPLTLAKRRLVKLQKLSMPFTCTLFLAKCLDVDPQMSVTAHVHKSVAAGPAVGDEQGVQRNVAPDNRPNCPGFQVWDHFGADPTAALE